MDSYSAQPVQSACNHPPDPRETRDPRDSLDQPPHTVRPLSATSSHSLGTLHQSTQNPASLPSSSSHHALGRGHPQQPQRPGEDPTSPRMFVRAIYDYVPADPSALTFEAGAVIEVLTQLESGWWDGMLGNVRGWFPSNFVVAITEDEALGKAEGSSTRGNGHEGRNGQGSVDEEDMGEGSRDGSREHRTVYEDELGWGDVMGRQSWAGGEDEGMDELARQVMRATVDDDADEGVEDFAAAAADRRRRHAQNAQNAQAIYTTADDTPTSRANRTNGANGSNRELGFNAMDLHDMGLGDMGADEFGLPRSRRAREDTQRTLTLKPSHLPRDDGDPPPGDNDSVGEKDGEMGKGGAENAWIPTLTPGGQVYYHNTITGEDTWHLPPTTPSTTDRDSLYDDNDNEFFRTLTASSSQALAQTHQIDTPSTAEDAFRIPQHKRELPAGWIVKMTDDGRGWYYANRLTGRTQKEPPVAPADSVGRLSVDSAYLPAYQARPKVRHSVEVRRKAVEDWSSKTRQALTEVLVPQRRQNMAWHIDLVQDGLRDVYEAAVAGSAAEEEMSRAHDLGSPSAYAAAQVREEAAIQMLKAAYRSLLLTIRTLFAAFGYVGPMEGMVDMPRPKWVHDMGIIGSLTVLSASVHSAVITKEMAAGTSNWSEVLRSAGKVKDVIAGFPSWVTPGAPKSVRDNAEGKSTGITLDVEGAGMLLGGRWGFGTMDRSSRLRVLDQAVSNELGRLRRDFHAVDYSPQRMLDVVRTVSKFKSFVNGIDIAEIVDVDGDMSDRTKEEDGTAYEELVVRITNALLDLEESSAKINESVVILYQRIVPDYETYGQLRSMIDDSYSAITSLLELSTRQRELAYQANIVHQIGHRSPRYVPASRGSTRPMSMVSNLSRNSRGSRGSRKSDDRSRVQGLDEEFLDNAGRLDAEAEGRDRAGELLSASTNASQTSLTQQQSRIAHRPTGSQGDISIPSAASSTTSLGFGQGDSDGASMRTKRSSLMKFMKGRSSQDDDSRGAFKSKGPSKKLAKLLGEDIQSIPTIPPPPVFSTAPPEIPWYLGEDYPGSDIIFDEKGAVRAGTLPALVARLTPHGSTDTTFFQAFLIMFRSFTTGPELLKLLIERYNLPEPEGMTELEAADWKKLKQTPIKLRVSNVIRSWLDVHYVEAQDVEVLDDIEEFASTTLLQNGSELMSRQLVTLVRRRRQGEGDTQRRIISGGMLSPPAPLLPRVPVGRAMKVIDIQPTELARQLTIMEFHHFQSIKVNECLNQAWSAENKSTLAPNVSMVIKMSNVVATWVTSIILGQRDVKARAGLVKYFTQTAMELRNLNNFSSMSSIMAGLNSSPVLRLKRTKEHVSQKTQAAKAELDRILDTTKNFQNYKNMLKTINPPCVPFLGFWLSALTFIEDGNKNFLNPAPPALSSASSVTSPAQSTRTATTVNTSDTAITPYQTSDEILRDVQQYQSQPYNLARCKPVYEWVTSELESWARGNPHPDKLYDVSLALEPREREEERVTRMLHDSGFI